jgi:choline dehydrogenase-like flavoprotein
MLRGFFDQTSNQKNKIYLSRKKDSLGDFKISINWNISKKDKKNIQKFISILKNVFRYNKIGLIESKNNAISTWKFNGIHSHFIGTTKMGSNPYNSVVDKNCRVHQIKNLYISGPSVFSNGGFANPFLTIAAISLRLGNHLSKKTLKQK